MASQDVKEFLTLQTGVAADRWKRRSKSKAKDGADLRVFEDSKNALRKVTTKDADGVFSIVDDTAVTEPSLKSFGILLIEEPSFDDHIDNFDEDVRDSLDMSCRWMTTLILGGGAAQMDPMAARQALADALPRYVITEPGGNNDSGIRIDDVFLVEPREIGIIGMATGESDRLAIQKALIEAGWCFAPLLAMGPQGETEVFTEISTIAVWTPGAQPTPLIESASWGAQAEELQRMVDDLPETSETELQDILNRAMYGHLPHEAHRSAPRPPATAASTTGSSSDAAEEPCFIFFFGENAHLPADDVQREWLEIYEQGNDDGHDHIEEVLRSAGIILPIGLDEVLENTFDYRFGKPAWKREELFHILVANGLTWDKEQCVLAQNGFDPKATPPIQVSWRPRP